MASGGLGSADGFFVSAEYLDIVAQTYLRLPLTKEFRVFCILGICVPLLQGEYLDSHPSKQSQGYLPVDWSEYLHNLWDITPNSGIVTGTLSRLNLLMGVEYAICW